MPPRQQCIWRRKSTTWATSPGSRERTLGCRPSPNRAPPRATRMASGLCRICSHEGESDPCDDTAAGNPSRVFALLRRKGPLRGELLSVQQVYAKFAQGRRFRSIRSDGFLGLGGYRNSVGKFFARCSVAVRFDPDVMALICLPEGSDDTICLAAQGLTKASLMGG